MPNSTSSSSDALSALIAGLPRDQALGLRLIGLARAAAACHLAEATFPPFPPSTPSTTSTTTPGARFTPEAHERWDDQAQVLRSQAAGLVGGMVGALAGKGAA